MLYTFELEEERFNKDPHAIQPNQLNDTNVEPVGQLNDNSVQTNLPLQSSSNVDMEQPKQLNDMGIELVDQQQDQQHVIGNNRIEIAKIKTNKLNELRSACGDSIPLSDLIAALEKWDWNVDRASVYIEVMLLQ